MSSLLTVSKLKMETTLLPPKCKLTLRKVEKVIYIT